VSQGTERNAGFLNFEAVLPQARAEFKIYAQQDGPVESRYTSKLWALTCGAPLESKVHGCELVVEDMQNHSVYYRVKVTITRPLCEHVYQRYFMGQTTPRAECVVGGLLEPEEANEEDEDGDGSFRIVSHQSRIFLFNYLVCFQSTFKH